MIRQRITLGELLTCRVTQHPHRTFVTFLNDDVTFSYGEFNRRGNQFAHALSSLGVSKGAHVVVLLRTSPDCLVISYALKKLGVVEVAVNADFRGPSLERTIKLTKAPLLITSPEFFPHLGGLPSGFVFIQTILVVGEQDTAFGSDVDEVRLCDLLPYRFDAPQVQLKDTDPCAVLFTSGTTGVSKGLVMSHRFAIRVAEGVTQALEVTENDCVYVPWPLYHYGAAYHDVLTAMLNGGRVALRR